MVLNDHGMLNYYVIFVLADMPLPEPDFRTLIDNMANNTSYDFWMAI
jgi:hypothetical protein